MFEESIPLLTFIAILSIVGTFFLSLIGIAYRRLGKAKLDKSLEKVYSFFFYLPIHAALFPANILESLYFAITLTRYIATFIAITSLSLITFLYFTTSIETTLLVEFIDLLLLFFLAEFIPHILGGRYPIASLTLAAFPASFFLSACLPISFVFLKLFSKTSSSLYFESFYELETETKREIFELIQHAEIESNLDPIDKRLIEAVITFHDRITREVMVPRVDLLALPANTTILEAAKQLDDEGYSRVPVYKNNIDNIVGILMYKDILEKFIEYKEKGGDEALLQAPIETIVKRVIYAPETKKISHLLQEFKARKVHMAIVVDEYGGTEGIATIEDILEEIVGDITDEYDEEEVLFSSVSDGGWLVDARMTISDIESELGIKLPQESDFDTIGGYIFHRAGSIPPKGFTIHHNEFIIKVQKSDERTIGKVRIIPINQAATNTE